MRRRDFLGAAPVALALAPPLAAASPTRMGIALTSYMMYGRPAVFEFLEHAHALGAAGIQAPLHGDPARIRARAEALGMYVEGMVALPKSGGERDFESAIVNAKAAGASCVRAGALSGRRYENFPSLDEWRLFVAASHASIQAAVPILEKHKMPLGLENHKDWTAAELLAIVRKYSTEYFGVCLDFGNNVSLLDDPLSLAEQLAPFTVATHVKDMAVESYPDGFLLAEVPLGKGFLDLPRMISLVRQARPATHFSLEMITRDPLRVPCLTDEYWVTFPDRNGIFLARTLKLVEEKKVRAQSLPQPSTLSHDAQLRLEEVNVKASLEYARDKPLV